MAYTTINKSTDYFNTKLYTGNSSTQALTGIGFQPDFVWTKPRVTGGHFLSDSIRGGTKIVQSADTGAESTRSNHIQSFDSDGFTLGADGTSNNNGDATVAWNWKAGTTSGINTTGADITPSSYSMNATSGISIIKFTGNGVDGAKIAHGLGAVPELIISKRLENSNYWAVYHKLDVTDYLVLNTDAAYSDAPLWKDTVPTSVYYTVDASTSVNATDTLVAYCFKSVPGYSKIGSYTGNGNADGTFVYTGFKPAFVMVKRSSGAQGWVIWDNKRPGYNLTNQSLTANENGAEETGRTFDMLSNGFKIRDTNTATNYSGSTYIYMAFGQSLVGSNGVTAKAR